MTQEQFIENLEVQKMLVSLVSPGGKGQVRHEKTMMYVPVHTEIGTM